MSACLLNPACVHATPEDDLAAGQAAYQQGDKARSFQLALKAARSGLVEAYGVVGVHYRDGIGVPADYAKSFFWFRKSAESGRSFGQYFLAAAYVNGTGVSVDLSAAMHFAQLALSGGEGGAQKILDAIRDRVGNNAYICMNYGFKFSSLEHGQCLMQLDQAQQQAQFQQQQYDLQQQQYQQQLAQYQAQQEAVRKEKERRKWAAIGMFGLGMANSTSPTFAGGMTDGLAAMNSNGATLVAPRPPQTPLPFDFTLRTADGKRANCTYDPTFHDLRCR